MAKQRDLQPVFERLKTILAEHAGALNVTMDESESYSLDAPAAQAGEKDTYFGGVQVRKNFVSFYLFPVYMYPDLLEGMSDTLGKRMQGKSCFNFKAVDEELFSELATISGAGLRRFKSEGMM